MLGYVKAFKPELKMGEYEIYRGIYCSLCRALGRNYGPLGRMFLSYDFVLAAVVRLGIKEEKCRFNKGRCPFNPTKKCFYCESDKELDLCAHAIIITIYYKLKDDLTDGSFLRKILCLFLLPSVALMHKKAKKKAPQIESIIRESMTLQREREKDKNCHIDLAAEPTAVALGKILSLECDEEYSDYLYNMGYFLGRFTYILDAVDDLERDIKSGNFNPFKKEFPDLSSKSEKERFAKKAKRVLNLTQGVLAENKEKKTLLRFENIAENILCQGLEQSAKTALRKYTGEKINTKTFEI